MEHTMKKRWGLLLISCVALLAAGIIYAWSIINAPFGALFAGLYPTEAALKSALTLNYTLTMCFFCLGGFVSGLLAKRIAGALRMAVSAALVFGGFFLVSRMSGESILPLYLGYGVMTGGGIGIVYNVVISTTNAWFPDRKGICTGAMMMSFGFSTLLLGNLAARLFAPEALGWRTTYLLYGAVIGAVLLAAGLLVQAPTGGTVLPKPAAKAGGGEQYGDIAARQMIRRGSFWRLFVFFVLFAAVGSTAIAGAKGQFAALGAGESAALLAGVLTVCNGLGRIVSGAFFDAFGLRRTQWLTSGVVITATALTFGGYALDCAPLGIVGLCLCGFSYGFSPTISAAFVAGFYGMKHFALNFPILNLILIPASFVPTLMSGLSDTLTFAVLTGFSLVGLAINFTIRKP